MKKIFCVKNEDCYKLITILGLNFKIKSKKLERKLARIQEYEALKQQVNQAALHALRITPRLCLDSIGFHLIDHCNLNCWGCDVCAPIADKRYTSLESFIKDSKKLAELTQGNVKNINLSGGEVLLHPDVLEICKAARQMFPDSSINLFSNGILILSKGDDFWQFLQEHNISVMCTKYPINVDYEKIRQKANEFGLNFKFLNNEKVVKTSYHIPFDPSGKQDERENFINCFHANQCIGLHDGKLYTCSPAANAHHFNKYFNACMEISDKDYINIHEATSLEEILAFLAKPIPFCKYCNVKARTFGHDWQVSKKEKSEWCIEN